MIAFISDWGYNSYYVGISKIVIYSISSKSIVIDLIHTITPFNVKEAACVIERIFDDLPKGATLLSVVDPGVGTSRKAIALEIDGKFCIGPDNGTFTRIFNRGIVSCHSIENPKYMYKYPPSTTFHGRDVFAAAAAHVDKGIPISDLGLEWENMAKLDFPIPQISNGMIKTEVAYVDGFGNVETLITTENLKRADVAEKNIRINGKDAVLVRNYSEGKDAIVAHFDSSGYLEISSNQGNASEILSLSCGDEITIQGS